MRVLISSCFVMTTRYDQQPQNKPLISELIDFLKSNNVEIIPVCPEQLGGLSTPRKPAEIVGQQVIDIDGNELTANFQFGAEQVVNLTRLIDIDFAILKENSPSCGVHNIYDGNHNRTLIPGSGITTKQLENCQIKVFSEEDILAIKEFVCKQKI